MSTVVEPSVHTTVGAFLTRHYLAPLPPGVPPEEEPPTFAFTEVDPLIDELADIARGGEAEAFQTVSARLKQGFLEALKEAPQDPEVLRYQAHMLAQNTLVMGLCAGALDAVVASVLAEPAGVAPEHLRPASDGRLARRYLEPLFDEQHTAASLDRVRKRGLSETTNIIAFHIDGASRRMERLSMSELTAHGFQRTLLDLFSNGYHVGKWKTLHTLPESKALAPENRDDGTPEPTIEKKKGRISVGGINVPVRR